MFSKAEEHTFTVQYRQLFTTPLTNVPFLINKTMPLTKTNYNLLPLLLGIRAIVLMHCTIYMNKSERL